MQRLLAVLLVLIGLIGLALGRLGETTWAPETEVTATAELADPGPAVVIDPGVLYVGGEEGEVVIDGASDVSVITAASGDIEAYLEDARYTRITGASDWSTLSTQEVNPDGAAELSDPTSSDLWRSVDTEASPYTLDIGEVWAAENSEENGQVYRPLLIVTDGTEPGAQKISITWPVDDENEWVPFAYAGGAAVAVIGLVLLVVSLGGRRREEHEPAELEDGPTAGLDTGAGGDGGADVDEVPAEDAESPVIEGLADEDVAEEDLAEEDPALEDPVVEDLAAGEPHDAPAEGRSAQGTPAEGDVDPDRTEQLPSIDEEEQR